MKPLTLLLFALLQFRESAVAQQKVEAVGITPVVKLEEVISGHLNELNGKFKLRVTELTFAPGASLGEHHHAGPGIRLVLAGELTFVQAGKAIVYRTGEYFFESGNVVHTARNATKAPVRVAFFEILPAQSSGPSLIPPRAY
jgi:quercetin dioxygenase-like cupin family protein